MSDTDPQAHSAEARKRKRSTADATENKRPFKRRSSKACKSCRTRKIRCDVLTTGPRCTNCRLDDTECIVLASRRGKHHQYARQNAVAERAARPPSPPASGSANGPRRAATLPPAGGMNAGSISAEMVTTQVGEVPVCVTFDEDQSSDNQATLHHRSMSDMTANATNMLHKPRDMPSPETWLLHQNGLGPPASGGPSSMASYQSSNRRHLLPQYIDPISNHVLEEDLEFLTQKQAFVIPEPELRMEIFRSYVFRVHPFQPIVDLRTVVHAISDDFDDGSISILLFQAIMFAGVSSLETTLVRRLGFESIKQAREAFFNRVSLLYEFDVETNEIAVLQSLLLMSWWYGKWNQRRHTWHWTGLAHSAALTLGLHREPTSECGDILTQRLRKRLWWSLYIRDRLLALGTRRIMRLRDDEFDVPMLTIDDFDIDYVCELGDGRTPVPTREENQNTAFMCIELAKLGVCIGHVLESQYTSLKTQSTVPHNLMVVPKSVGDRTADALERCDEELRDWFHALSTSPLRHSATPSQNGYSSCTDVHWSILHMLYYTLVNVLHRTPALQPSSDTAKAQDVQKASRAKVKESARSVTKLTYTMLRRDQARFLGVPGVTALVATCLSHMLDIRSGDEDLRDASILRFYQSMQVLQALRDIYASADSAVSFLASVIRKAGISVPSRVATPSLEVSSELSEQSINQAPVDARRGSEIVGPSPRESQNRRWTYSQGQRFPASTDRPDFHVTPSPVQPSNVRLPPIMPFETGQSGSYTSNASTLPIQPSHESTDLLTPYTSSTGAFAPQPIPGVAERSLTQVMQTAPLESGPYANDSNGAFYDWNGGLELGLDLSAMDQNYDFSSDVFSFLQDQFPGL